MRDHGGNLDAAIRRFGGNDWIDLSTGINRQPYPVPVLPVPVWTMLPTQNATAALCEAAAAAYGTQCATLPVAGAQQAIQLIPRLWSPGLARVLTPTYNEHAASLAMAGWQVEETADFASLAGADLAVIVNPNNPDGAMYPPEAILDLARKVRYLVVDESFADSAPEVSVASQAGVPGMIVLRSFGKFFGLAGLRLGFVIGHPSDIAGLSALAGPWPVSGAALEIGRIALSDAAWADATRLRLAQEAGRIDRLAGGFGWQPGGGTTLFRLYETPDAVAAQDHLARYRIWSRIFPYSRHWLRLGLPGPAEEWQRLAAALSAGESQQA
jgi:cobalamin biosynthesis protein CobC